MAPKTPTATINDARAKIAQVEEEITRIDTDLSTIANELGKALAAMRMGDKRAERTAGELSLKRAELTRKRHDTDLTRTALEETITRMEAEAAAEQRAATVAEWNQLNADVRALEARFADQITAAGETAKQLQDAGQEWRRLRTAVAKLGENPGAHRPPAPAAALLRANVADNHAHEVALWKRRYIDPSLPVPVRPLDAFELERRKAREIEAEARAKRKAERDAEDSGPFMLFQKGA